MKILMIGILSLSFGCAATIQAIGNAKQDRCEQRDRCEEKTR